VRFQNGDFERFKRSKSGGGHAIQPLLASLLHFKIQGVALAA
jgi:hypothetical protein